MKIEPKNGPSIVTPSVGQVSARDKAISAFMESAAQNQQSPVQNPTQVSPEELSVVKSPESQDHRQQADTSSNTLETKSSPEPEATKKPEESKSEPLSPQFAQLAKKERALRAKAQQQETAMKARESELAAREEALKAKESEYQSNYISKSKLTTDPLSVLTEAGVSYDDLTRAILNPQSANDPRIMAELERLKSEVQETKKLQESAKQEYINQQKQAYQQAVSQIRNETKKLVSSDPSFEAIKATNSIDDVVSLIERVYNKDGVLMTVEEAAGEVENYLTEKLASYAQIKKIQSRLAPKQTPVQKQETERSQQQQPTMKTLTNSANASKKLSARERAIAAFKGEKL